MSLNLQDYRDRVSVAVKNFWIVRGRSGVRGGKTLDAFVDLLKWVVHQNGLQDAVFLSGRNAQLPGFFRPTKSWDLLIMNDGKLIAAIELKSIADSFGKNAKQQKRGGTGKRY